MSVRTWSKGGSGRRGQSRAGGWTGDRAARDPWLTACACLLILVRTGWAAPRDFTPEERTNIAVYEAANRSVVNINTKATVATGLFLLEVPSEGAGSGIVLDGQGHQNFLPNFKPKT